MFWARWIKRSIFSIQMSDYKMVFSFFGNSFPTYDCLHLFWILKWNCTPKGSLTSLYHYKVDLFITSIYEKLPTKKSLVREMHIVAKMDCFSKCLYGPIASKFVSALQTLMNVFSQHPWEIEIVLLANAQRVACPKSHRKSVAQPRLKTVISCPLL